MITTSPSPPSATRSAAELARCTADELAVGSPDGPGWATAANRTLVATSRHDLATGCLAFRVLTNTVRLAAARDSGSPFAGSAAYDEVVASLRAGRLLVTGLHHERTVASTVGSRLRITASGLLVTGIAYADHLLLEAHIDGDLRSSLVIVPTTAIVDTRRPTMRGLRDADNALVSVETTLPLNAALFSVRGAGRELIEASYAAGLTFGAVACGGLLALCDTVERVLPAADAVLGQGLADAAAASTLVEASGAASGHASWLSRAAKVFATTAADRFATASMVAAGPAAYAVDHPVTSLAGDLAGLAFQAPTNVGSLGWLAHRAHELLVDVAEGAR